MSTPITYYQPMQVVRQPVRSNPVVTTQTTRTVKTIQPRSTAINSEWLQSRPAETSRRKLSARVQTTPQPPSAPAKPIDPERSYEEARSDYDNIFISIPDSDPLGGPNAWRLVRQQIVGVR